jgi:multidrug resistance efflux pump
MASVLLHARTECNRVLDPFTYFPSTMTANASNPSNARQFPFQVVPPSQLRLPRPTPDSAPATSPPTEPEPTSEATAPTTPTRPNRRKLLLGVAIASLTGIAFIPTPYEVGGSVQLTWKEASRQAVHTTVPATVQQLRVKTGDRVQPGQILAELSSPELDREIAEVQEKIMRSRQEIETAYRSQIQAEATLIEANARERAIQVQASRSSDRINALDQGILPPEMQSIRVEQQQLEGQLKQAQSELKRYEQLHNAGAIALIDVETRQGEVRDLQHRVTERTAQMSSVQQQLSDRATDETMSAAVQQSNVVAAQTIVAVSQNQTAQVQTIEVLEQRLKQLTNLRSNLILRATTSGTVITSDLDLVVGQEIRPDKPLLQIANLGQLTANVEIKEEDLDSVEMGAAVTFRPRQSKLQPYNARVEDVLYNVEADATQQQRVATVRVVIDNSDGRLRPGSSGYARIFSEWTPLYQRVGREVLKLVPERFL